MNNVNDTDVSYKDNSINIPIGYTYQTIQEYVPQNEVEENLLSYLHEYSLD